VPYPPCARRRGHVRRARRGHERGALSGSDPAREGLRIALAGRLLDPEQAASLAVPGRSRAAVLVALYFSEGALHAVFTRRRDDLRRHAGEVSFPGGRADPGDASLIVTALREAEEEIGLPPAGVELLGALAPTSTVVTGYAVYPFVGLIEPGQQWRPSADEVADVLELAVSDVRAGYGRRRLTRRGLPIRTDVYDVGGEVIWGATARIVSDLLERLAPALDGGHAPGMAA